MSSTKRNRDADADTKLDSTEVNEKPKEQQQQQEQQPSWGPARVVYNQDQQSRLDIVKNFIGNLKLTVPIHKLRENSARRPCPKCGKNRQYYCYDCMVVSAPETHPPSVKLPFDVHVLLHPGESKSKSTTRAASTLSSQMKIHLWPEFPEGIDIEKTALLYPSPQAVCLDEMSAEELSNIEGALFVDSTWQQSKAISRDPRLAKAKHIKIKSQVSLFWRFQDKDPSYLATIEAIYYFLKEYIMAQNKKKQEGGTSASTTTTAGGAGGEDSTCYYNGEVDDLLHYYVNQYITIQSNYVPPSAGAGGVEGNTDGKKQFTSRHFADYVLEGADWSEFASKKEDEKKGEKK